MPPLPAAARRASSSADGLPVQPRASAIWRVCCGEMRSACAPISNTPRLLRAVASRSAVLLLPMKMTRAPSGSRSAIVRSSARPSTSVVSASALSITSVIEACGAARSAQSAAPDAASDPPFLVARPRRGSQTPPSWSAAKSSASVMFPAARIQRTGASAREAQDETELLFPYPALPAMMASPPGSRRSSSRSRRDRSPLI